MYPVRNVFLDAVKANNSKYYWTGRITTTAGTVYEFDQDDMVKYERSFTFFALFVGRKEYYDYNKHDIQLSC